MPHATGTTLSPTKVRVPIFPCAQYIYSFRILRFLEHLLLFNCEIGDIPGIRSLSNNCSWANGWTVGFLVISRNEETSPDLSSIVTACGLCAFPGKQESAAHTAGLESFIPIPFAIYCSTTQNSPFSWLQNSTLPCFFLRLLFHQVFRCQEV